MANLGTGGNNQPFVVQTPKTLKIRSGREGGGKGALIQDNMSATLSCNNEQTVFVPKAYHINQRNEGIDLEGKSGALMASQNLQMQTFVVEDKKKMAFGICSKDSNSMKSDNPIVGSIRQIQHGRWMQTEVILPATRVVLLYWKAME